MEVSNAATQEFGPQLVAAKGNGELQKTLQQHKRERIAYHFKMKLEGLLFPNPKSAWEAAAAQELANAAKPKPQT